MRTFLRYKSDISGKQEVKELFVEHLPIPRVGDTVCAEGRPRTVYRRQFHLLGKGESGPWWPVGVEEDDDTLVVISLIG